MAKPDFLFWTGDNSPHDTWKNTQDAVTNASKTITEMIKNTLTNENNIQVFPTLGNHDTWPVDMENFSKANSIEPITELEDPWAEWIGEDNAK